MDFAAAAAFLGSSPAQHALPRARIAGAAGAAPEAWSARPTAAAGSLGHAALAACGLAVATWAARRAPRFKRAGALLVRQAEESPAPKQDPEIDPRPQDPPSSVPPVLMPVVDSGDGGKLDVMSKLLQDRIIILGGEVKDENAQILIAQMLYLASEDPNADITMYINSPGGSVSAGLSIFDTMQFIPCDVATVCFGLAASMGSFLLSAGTKGKRKSLPNSRIMIHQPLGGAQGQASDVRIQTREILFLRDILNQHLADATGKTPEQIELDCDRDNFMTPEEALEYGLIDAIIPTKSWPRIQKPPRPEL